MKRRLMLESALIPLLSPTKVWAFPRGHANSGVATDGFTSGMYVPDFASIGPDSNSTSIPIFSGFVRGTSVGSWTLSAITQPGQHLTYKGGGVDTRDPPAPNNPFFTCTVTATTANSIYFTAYLTTLGVSYATGTGLSGQYPWLVAFSATNGTTTYSANLFMSTMPSGVECCLPGVNVLPATQSPSSGRYVLGGTPSAQTVTYTLPPPTLAAGTLPLIPNSQFSAALRVFGDWGDGAWFGGRATATANPAHYPSPPCFFAWFWKPEGCAFSPQTNGAPYKTSAFGEPYAYGDQTNQVVGGAIALITEGCNVIQWNGTGFTGTEASVLQSGGTSTQPFTAGPWLANGLMSIGQWNFSAMEFPVDPSSAANPTLYYQDGQPGGPPFNNGTSDNYGTIPWITGNGSDPLEYTFGCDRDANQTGIPNDVHVFNGLIRNCISVRGNTTTAQLNSWRANPTLANAQSIWGSGNILSLYLFDGAVDPEAPAAAEPDQTGNNGSCLFYNAGVLPWAPPPQLAVTNQARIGDITGVFEMVNVSGSTYSLRTKSGSFPPYGSYQILMVGPNGFQFITTIFVTNGT